MHIFHWVKQLKLLINQPIAFNTTKHRKMMKDSLINEGIEGKIVPPQSWTTGHPSGVFQQEKILLSSRFGTINICQPHVCSENQHIQGSYTKLIQHILKDIQIHNIDGSQNQINRQMCIMLQQNQNQNQNTNALLKIICDEKQSQNTNNDINMGQPNNLQKQDTHIEQINQQNPYFYLQKFKNIQQFISQRSTNKQLFNQIDKTYIEYKKQSALQFYLESGLKNSRQLKQQKLIQKTIQQIDIDEQVKDEQDRMQTNEISALTKYVWILLLIMACLCASVSMIPLMINQNGTKSNDNLKIQHQPQLYISQQQQAVENIRELKIQQDNGNIDMGKNKPIIKSQIIVPLSVNTANELTVNDKTDNANKMHQ